MKLTNFPILLLFFLLATTTLKAQTILMPEDGQGETQILCEGTIQDPGGDEDYPGNMDGWLTIAPAGSGELVLTFTQFNMEFGYDYLSIYDGPDLDAPLIGQFSGTDLPGMAGATDGIIIASEQVLTLQVLSDPTVNYEGFTATWATGTTSGGTPEADFETPPSPLAFNAAITFTDASTNADGWLWDFGDGNTSTEQNPTHSYTQSGDFEVTLTINNCYGEMATTSQTISVQEAPIVSASPSSLEATLAFGDSLTLPININNTGNGNLVLNITGAALSSEKDLQILALVNGANTDNEYLNALEAIATLPVDYQLIELTTYDAEELANALVGMDVLWIPEQAECDSIAFSSFMPVLQSFANLGGTIVMNGSNQHECIFNTGLFEGEYIGFANGEVSLNNPEDPILEGVANPYEALNITYLFDITNTDATRLVEYDNGDGIYDILCYRNIGEGKVILINHDFLFHNEDIDRILTNSLQTNSEASLLNWLFIPLNEITIEPGGSWELLVEFNATTVYGGTYQTDLVIATNDPNNPQIIIPCTIHIEGTPDFAIAPETIDFGEAIVGQNIAQTIQIFNPGTDSLYIQNITVNNPAFSLSTTSLGVYGGNAFEIVTLTFSPTEITNYDATLTIETNIGVFDIPISAIGLGAPLVSVTPTPVNITVNAGETTTFPLSISNTGEGPLTFEMDTSLLVKDLQILAYINGADYINEYTNTLDALNLYYTDYDLTETATENPGELADLLVDKQIMLVPEIEDFSTTSIFTVLGNTMEEFVANGGTIIFTGTSGTNPLFNSGMMSGEQRFDSFLQAEVLEEHPIVDGLTDLFFPSNGTYPALFYEDDIIDLVVQEDTQYGGYSSIVAYRPIGNGNVVFIAFDYFEYDEKTALVLGNTVQWVADELVSWLDFDTTSGTLDFPAESTIDLAIDATDLLGGTYTTEVVIFTNDPLNPTITIPITLTVIGIPQINVSETTLDFGNVIISTFETLSFTITNPGTDSLFIDNISSNLDNFVTNITSITLAPYDSTTIEVIFVPLEMQDYDATITIANNVGDVVINVTGVGQGAPIGNINPEGVEAMLLAGESTSQTVSISNTGAGPLNFNNLGNSAQPAEILLLSYGAANSYTVIEDLLAEYYDNYNFTEINTNDVNDLNDALEGKNILIIPPQETFAVNPAVLATFVAPLQNFVNNGGTIIYTGTSCENCLNAAGFFDASFSLTILSDELTVQNAEHPITQGFPETFLLEPTVYSYAFNNPDLNILVSDFLGGTVVAYREIGIGKVLYLGHNFQNPVPAIPLMLTNALDWGRGNLPDWLSISIYEGTLAVGETIDIDINFDATDMLAGTYEFTLTFFTNDPDNPIIFLPCTLMVETFPQANFSSNQQLSCDGVVNLEDISLNFPTSWYWDFGDGNTSEEENPSHTYAEEGTYTVSLEACNDIGCDTRIKEDYITVDFASLFCDTIPMPTTPEVELFTGCTGVLTDPGGNEPYEDGLMGIITIAPPDAYLLTLTFNFMDMEACCDYIRIYNGTDNVFGFLGTFTGAALPNSLGIIEANSGAVTIEFFSDEQASTSSFEGFEASWQCAVPTEAPAPNFEFDILEDCAGTTIFTDLSAYQPSSWNWDFGDGTTSEEQSPTHSFLQSGTYTVSLEACNIAGCETFSQELTVSDVLFVNFTTLGTVEVGQVAFFEDLTENAISWQWNWGDGSLPVNGTATPLHVYENPGVYTVSLTVEDSDGCSRTVSQVIDIVPVGIGDLPAPQSLQVYPNPAQDVIHLQWTQAEINTLNNAVLKMYDVTGKLIFDKTYPNAHSLPTNMNLAHLPQGRYFILLEMQDGVVVESFVKK